ncbi:hypothetical protein CANINC_002295 [Pichia inconspicua]|uniref:Rhodanese domain-containing protein n=1 Tax=Pichia inconspicua TaxID=52247 RepID=A0A4T0X1Y1_9ASCO|nr:hypothetical protein CANINC_002295 [[Candida] inconspicua]
MIFSQLKSSNNVTKPFLQSRMISLIAPASVNSFYDANKNKIVSVDATWYMPDVPMNGFNEFQKRRLKDAVFFDIEKIKDHESDFPHMLPSQRFFEKEVSRLGICNDDNIVFYDQQGVFSLCRAAWMFEVFGHDLEKIYILNTFPGYSKNTSDPNLVMKLHGANTLVDESIVTSSSTLPKSEYKTKFDDSKVVSYEQLLSLVQDNKIGDEYTLIDARSASRFTGEAPEPREGLSSGHIKNAINIPFTELLTPDKSFLSTMTLNNIFKRHNVDDSKPIIVMCGTGVTACVVRAAMQLAGFDSSKIAVYDGSWTEWAQRAPSSLIVKDI